MEVVPLGSADEIAVLAADTIEAVVRRKPAAVLGLATGSTPLPTYRELHRRHAAAVGSRAGLGSGPLTWPGPMPRPSVSSRAMVAR